MSSDGGQPGRPRAVTAHLQVIGAVRGAAALLVAFLHTRQITWIGIQAAWEQFGVSRNLVVWLGYLTFPVVWGSVGVPIFFVVSGYCIHRSHAVRLAGDSAYRLGSRRYLQRRFFRIYPVLLAALVLTFVCDWVAMRAAPGIQDLGTHSAIVFLGNVASVQGWLVPPFGSNGPLWTLSIEVQLYLFYIFLFSFRRRWGIPRTALLAVAINAVSICITRGLFTSYLVSWCLGAYLAEPGQRLSVLPKARRLFAAGLLLLAALGVFFTRWQDAFFFILSACAFALVLSCLLQADLAPTPTLRVFDKLGEFSYSLYSVHRPLAVLAGAVILRGVRSQFIAVPLLVLGLVVFMAYVFHLVVERPWLKRSGVSGGSGA